jgi:DNA-binding CsgD family transcriptional regulator
MDGSGEYTAQNLSPRQGDVLKLIVRGQTNKEIARTLHIAEGTVKVHVAALFHKLRVTRRAAVAIAGGVISLPATGVPPILPDNRARRVSMMQSQILSQCFWCNAIGTRQADYARGAGVLQRNT